MSAAGHRFESHAKPLGRSCIYIHATILTALRVWRTRTDESSSRAKRFLSWVSDEKMLQAAMLADAADSSLHFTRLMDREDLDPAILSTECHMYLASMKALFCEGQIFDRFGFTSTMMKTLAQPMVFQVGAETRCLGDAAGVAADVKTICLQRMQSWVRLAEAALQAEFPEFELAQAGLAKH